MFVSLYLTAQYDLFHNSCSTDRCLNHLYTANRKPAGSMQPKLHGTCWFHAEVTISPYLQYTSNLTKDISSLVYCLTMFDVCHMFVFKYYLRPIFNSF